MSYLNLPSGIPNFSKAVISFWFRVPRQSLQDTWDIYNAETSRSRLFGIMPLLTFGETFEGYKINAVPGPPGSYTHNSWRTPGSSWALLTSQTVTYSTGTVQSKGDSFECDPCFVGIVVRTETTDDDVEILKGYLKVFLQTASNGSPTNVSHNMRLSIGEKNSGNATGSAFGTFAQIHWSYLLNTCATDDAAPNNPWIVTRTPSEDISDFFLQQNGPDAFDVATSIEVTPDTWHHVLISFDVSAATNTTGTWVWDEFGACPGRSSSSPVRTETPATFSNPAKIWLAFDDRNYTGDDLRPPINAGGIILELEPNDILSRNSISTAQSINGGSHDNAWDVAGCVIEQTFDSGPAATYTLESVLLPTANQPFGIPASADLVDKIHKVEMAEFQMWTGVTLDTAVEANRRAFIDYQRDERGNPIPDEDGELRLKPVKPEVAEALLGKRPDLLLHKTSKWQKGENTGSRGKTPDGELIPAGQFDPTGAIDKYKPDPSIVPSS